jgi:hypothetical protein
MSAHLARSPRRRPRRPPRPRCPPGGWWGRWRGRRAGGAADRDRLPVGAAPHPGHQAEVLAAPWTEVLAGVRSAPSASSSTPARSPRAAAGADTLQGRARLPGLRRRGRAGRLRHHRRGARLHGPGARDLRLRPRGAPVLGMKVLDNKETPGARRRDREGRAASSAASRKERPAARRQAGAGPGGESEVDMITGATISARTVISVINNRIEKLHPLLEAPCSGGGR